MMLQCHPPSKMKRQIFLVRKPRLKQSYKVSSVENNGNKTWVLLWSYYSVVKGPTFLPFSSPAPRSLQKRSQKHIDDLPCDLCTKVLLKLVWYWQPVLPSSMPEIWPSCNSGCRCWDGQGGQRAERCQTLLARHDSTVLIPYVPQ